MNLHLKWMAFGDAGEHGQAAARPVLAAKRFAIENVIVQLEIMVEKHVLVLNKTIVLAISRPAPVFFSVFFELTATS